MLNKKIILGFLLWSISWVSFAAVAPASPQLKSLIPGSIQQFPTVTPSNQPTLRPRVAPVTQEAAQPAQLGKEAAKIHFVLKKIIIEDAHVYSEKDFLPLYQDKLNKNISVADVVTIVNNITNLYRNNGYILSRAVLPPQEVNNGIIRIRVIEGFIDQVDVVGSSKGSEKILKKFGEKIAANKPTQIKVMEYYLRLMNEIPGVQVRAVLEPSKKVVAASHLNLAVDAKRVGGFASYDNYGTRYIGPQQITTGGNINSLLRSGDTTTVTYLTTPKPKEIKYFDIAHETPLGATGGRFRVGYNDSVTHPLFILAPLNIAGQTQDYYTSVTYPIIRSRDRNLTVQGSFNVIDSWLHSFGAVIYMDHIRPIEVGANYDWLDRFLGANAINAQVEKGMPWMDASMNAQSITTSRFGGTANYLKVNAQATRLQLFNNSPVSIFGLIRGQYSFNPLLSYSQFAYGGSQLGRGYDPAEILGDRGAAASVEFRWNSNPNKLFLNAVQYYVFYDAGIVWNIRHITNVQRELSAMSTGIGARMQFMKNLSGNLMYTLPLTRRVAAENIFGNGSAPRIFFSVVLAS